MISQEELEEQGSELLPLAHENGLSALTDEQIRILHAYEIWKDGADWGTLEDLDKTDRKDMAEFLTHVFGHKE